MLLPIKKKVLIWSLIGAIFIIGLGLGLYFAYKAEKLAPRRGAVVANGIECAKIGSDILVRNGSVVDAAIATLFCEGVTMPQSMGLGGGFLATIYIKSTGKIRTLVARERAPMQATQDMFVNKTMEGAIATAVPGEVKGYWALHEKYGKLHWRELIEPTIELCRKGHIVNGYLSRALKGREDRIRQIPSLKEIFFKTDEDRVFHEGEIITRPVLADTLALIAEHGEGAIYAGGIIGQRLVKDIQEMGGIITAEDLQNYKVNWTKPVVVELQDKYTLYTTPLPGSGHVLGFILSMIDKLLPVSDVNIMWQRIIETFKHAYGLRTRLGDPEYVPEIKELLDDMTDSNFVDQIRKLIKDDRTFNSFQYYGANFSNPEDSGTANMAIIGPDGDAITVTSTINNIFGAMRRSPNTGIILNDQMDDFATPGRTNQFGLEPSPANFIVPNKRPLSSMCPSIIIDRKGDVKLAIGAAGGSKITSSIASTIIHYLYLDESLDNSIQDKRIHHQLAPMVVQHEIGFDQGILNYLQSIGHKLFPVQPDSGFAALTAIGVEGDNLLTIFDHRRNGSTSIVEF